MKPYHNMSKDYPHAELPHSNGVQKLYKFENNRGASVISQPNGKWKLTWIIWSGGDYKADKCMEVQDNLTETEIDLCLGAIAACAPVPPKK
jgi:hypothetical protein